MFSDQLVNQLSQFIIRPHREVYGLDKLGPKKLIIKCTFSLNYIEVVRNQCTIISDNKKIQISLFEPMINMPSTATIPGSQSSQQYNHKPNKNNKDNIFFQEPTHKNNITIFLHTNSGSRLEGLQYVKYLLQYGHIACLFDYSGSGVSEGEYITMGINESKDLFNVVKYLRQKFKVDKVNLWGRSMGAVTAVLFSSKYPKYVNRMVLDSPFCSFRQLVKEIVNSRTGLPEFLFGAILSRIEQNLEEKLQINLMNIDLKTEIVKPGLEKIPIYFLISKQDKLVLPSHVETLYELHKGYKKMHYLDGSHNKPRSSEVRQKCAEFLCNKINCLSSDKTLEFHKKQYLSIISRNYSQQLCDTDKRSKLVTSSLIIGQNEPTQDLLQSNKSHTGSIGKEKTSFNINLSKKGKVETYQSSNLSTPRDQVSANKYPSTKISLSQIKKAHQADNTGSKQQAYTYNPVKANSDFKKQSRTMAIQYKNKIKEHISKS